MPLSPILIAALAAGAVLLIAIGISFSGSDGQVASRLERYASAGGMDGDAGDGERESAVVAGLNRVIERQDMATRLSIELARADLKLKPAEFILAWIASPFVFVAAAYILGFLFSGLHNVIALALIFAFGAYFPRFYLRYRQGKRVKLFAKQLPDTITLLANTLRAGSSFLQGVELITREARPPISEEFGRVVREMNLGVALQPALNNMSRRVQVRGPGADGHRDQHPEPGRRKPRDRPRLDRLHDSRAGTHPG